VPITPSAPAKQEADAALPAVILTVGEAQKVLRTSQVVRRMRIRSSPAGGEICTDFLHLCCDTAGPDGEPSDTSTQQVWVMLDKTIFHMPYVVQRYNGMELVILL